MPREALRKEGRLLVVYVTGSHLGFKYTEGEGPGVYSGETVPRPLNSGYFTVLLNLVALLFLI